MIEKIIEVDQISTSKNGKRLFDGLSWSVNYGENWLIMGPAGSGKTLLAEALVGNVFLEKGRIRYFFDNYRKDKIKLISFSEHSSLFNYDNHYYQQRYNFFDSETGITVREYMSGSPDVSLLKAFGLENCLDTRFIKLSNGQTRKIRLIKALESNPKILIIDCPYVGLDKESKELLNKILNYLPSKGISLIIISDEHFPTCVTHFLVLENFAIKNQGPIGDLKFEQLVEKEPLNFPPVVNENPIHTEFEIAVKFENVTIKYDQNEILKDINWEVKKGEKWALLGPNGAGKSTIFSLINADHPQAYSQNIWLFDRKRGTGESIWHIKSRIGFVSPELQLYFKTDLNAIDVVATGLTSSQVLNRKLSGKEKDILDSLFDHFEIENIKEQLFWTLSFGVQRLLLFIRALVKNPALLILDEPYQGLSLQVVRKCNNLLNRMDDPQRTLIFITHDLSELPSCVNKTFYIKDGVGSVIKT